MTALGVFLKYPHPGKVKTRLSGFLGAEGAAELYRKMVERIKLELARYPHPLDIFYFYDPYETQTKYVEWLGVSEAQLIAQSGVDLGARLCSAFNFLLSKFASALVIGTDCVELRYRHIVEATNRLKESDVVMGPAMDGGYYLIGLSKPAPFLFDGIAWSTDRVLNQTIALAKEHNLKHLSLETLRDIDTPEDLESYQDESDFFFFRYRKAATDPISIMRTE